jgi:hypothetical protein
MGSYIRSRDILIYWKRKYTSREWSSKLLELARLNKLWKEFLVRGLPIPYARALPVTSLMSVQSLATIFHPSSSSGLVNLSSVSTLSVPVPSVSVDSIFIGPNRNSRKVDLKLYLDRSHLKQKLKHIKIFFLIA